MRKIRFRVWDGLTMRHTWDRWSQYTDILGEVWDIAQNDYKYAVMQYTGLKDKNGVEVYEGDLIKYEEINENGIAEVKDFNGSLVFWWLKQETACPSMFDATYYFGHAGSLEVIGNIYQNPELLEQNHEARD